MACKEWNEGLVAHLYAELDPVQEAALAEHLGICSGCRSTLEDLSSVRRTLGNSSPIVPGIPRFVILAPRASRAGWFFAAGLATAALLVAAFLAMGPPREEPQAPSQVARLEIEADARDKGETIAGLESAVRTLEARLESLESRPATIAPDAPPVSRAEFQLALDRLTRRFERERAQDLESLVQAMTATELRTGTWLDQTREAVNLLALRQDPRLRER